jgi:hypothetical protein
MKTIIPLAIILILGFHVVQGQVLEKEISLSYSHVSLEKILSDIGAQYGLSFSYSPDLTQLDRKVSIEEKNIGLRYALEKIFSQVEMEFMESGNQIAIRRKRGSTSLFVLRGEVKDKITNISLPFASVRMQGTPVGTMTNGQGEFVLNVPAGNEHASVTISSIGYKNYRVTLGTSPLPSSFLLEEDATELAAVTVMSNSGRSILREAISRIKENYDTSSVLYTYFMRDVSYYDGTAASAGEAVYQAYRGSLNRKPAKQLKAVKGRRVKDFAFIQRVFQAFPRFTSFEVGVDRRVVLSAELNAKKEDGEFPSQKFLKQHDFELLGTSILDGRDVYVIEFDQSDLHKKKPLYKGKFYIDTESLAFIRMEWALSPKGIKNARFFSKSNAVALLFGFSECTVLGHTAIMNYKPWNGKWYPSMIEMSGNILLQKSRKNFSTALNFKTNVVVTDIQRGAKPFDPAEVLTSRDLQNSGFESKFDYWGGYNAVPSDPEFEEAIQSIRENNNEHGFDTKFWRKFHPHLSEREFVMGDSQACPLDTAAILGAKEDDLMKPRYPVLDRSVGTRHFLIHYLAADSAYAQEILPVLEDNYNRVLRDFHMKLISELTHIELYPDVEHYHFAIGNPDLPQSEVGMATDDNIVKMVSPRNPGTYHTRESLLKVAVHEFAHCVHYRFLDLLSEQDQRKISQGKEAFWLFEAIAIFEAGQFYDPAKFEYLRNGSYPSLATLNDVEGGKIYDVGFVLIDFMQRTWGQEKVWHLLRVNGDIENTFAITEDEFQRMFYAYVETTYLQRAGLTN